MGKLWKVGEVREGEGSDGGSRGVRVSRDGEVREVMECRGGKF